MATQSQSEPSRPTADVVYARVREDAEDELARKPRALAFSGLFAGFTIGLTPLAVAAALVLLGGSDEKFVAAFFYPAGFVAVILGRAQFFTENTLYPVVASIEDRSCIPRTARLWAIVLAANLTGAFVFALLAMETPALGTELPRELAALGEEAEAGGFWENFWSGVLAGWLLALVAWLVEASEAAVGQFLVIWVLTMVIGLVPLDHSVATAIEVLGGTIEGAVSVGDWFGWLAAVVLGNVVGGVFIVTVLNYGQVR